MTRILVLYASTHGHTGRIARRIADVLEEDGVAAEVRDVATAADVDPAAYDGVVAGGSIHGGRHQRELEDWARRHARHLDAVPSAFFSVCLAVADPYDAVARAKARSWIDDFQDDTGWTPDRSVTFAGALQFREYDAPTRLLMRLMMARGGHPTDTRRDHDFTDWDAVEAFAHEVAALATRREEAAAV